MEPNQEETLIREFQYNVISDRKDNEFDLDDI